MGTSRYDVDRQTKVSAILDEARVQLAEGGYEGLSTSAVARQLGVRPNTISWYFPSKDDLLLGVVKREWEAFTIPVLERFLGAKRRYETQIEVLLHGLDLIYERRHLAIAIHQRLDHSPTVKTYHDFLYAAGRKLGPRLMDGLVRPGDQAVATSIILTLIEGQLLHEMTPEERHEQIVSVLDLYTMRASQLQ